jgi:ribosome maturation protein Sdo1
MVDKFTIVRLSAGNEKFEILVKPDPALEYKLGKRLDISNIMISDEIYSDANKGTRLKKRKDKLSSMSTRILLILKPTCPILYPGLAPSLTMLE